MDKVALEKLTTTDRQVLTRLSSEAIKVSAKLVQASEALLRAADTGEIDALSEAIGYLVEARAGRTDGDVLDGILYDADDLRVEYI